MLRYLILFTLPLILAFNFSPMTQTIRLDKEQTKTQFKIDNPSNKNIPVVIKAYERIQNKDGSEKLPPTDKIKVFPPQVIVPPNEKRSIRIDWKGPENINEEMAFRVVAEQVPLSMNQDDSESSSGIKMLLKYQSALYVNPGNTKPNVELKEFQVDKKLKVTLVNKGNTHKYIKGLEILFKKDDKELSPSQTELKNLNGQNILAGSTRVFEFKKPKGLDSSFSAHLKMNE